MKALDAAVGFAQKSRDENCVAVMANSFGADILIQAENPLTAAGFYVQQLGFTITGEQPDLVSLEGPRLNFYIERGPELGPVLEVTVATSKKRRRGCVQPVP
jgi:hypothetical protein